MKIRIMGTKEELDFATDYYKKLETLDFVKSVSISRRYPNRGSNTISRLYVEVEYMEVLKWHALTRSQLGTQD